MTDHISNPKTGFWSKCNLVRLVIAIGWTIGVISGILAIYVWLYEPEFKADILKTELQKHMDKHWGKTK